MIDAEGNSLGLSLRWGGRGEKALNKLIERKGGTPEEKEAAVAERNDARKEAGVDKLILLCEELMTQLQYLPRPEGEGDLKDEKRNAIEQVVTHLTLTPFLP